MKAIVAVDEKWGIGRKGNLLFSVPKDMAFFRQKTSVPEAVPQPTASR